MDYIKHKFPEIFSMHLRVCFSILGAALMRVVEVYKDIQDQQMNIVSVLIVFCIISLRLNQMNSTPPKRGLAGVWKVNLK